MGSGKTLCEVLAAADVMPLHMAGSRVDGNSSRRYFMRSPLQRDGYRTWSRLPWCDCYATRTVLRLIRQRKRRSKRRIRPCSPASGSAG